MRRTVFWLRWSWRDLRQRWVLVAAIALVIAIGTGVFTGLASVSSWRERSIDTSYERVNVADLRVDLSENSYVPSGALLTALGEIPHSSSVEGAQERLVVPSEIDASRAGKAILVPGQIVGMTVTGGGSDVDQVGIEEGRGLRAGDAGRPIGILEAAFAQRYDLPAAGTVRAADRQLSYVGLGQAPEEFVLLTPVGLPGREAQFAVVYTSLATAQELSGHPGAVNELVVRLVPGADGGVVKAELERALARRLPDIGATVTPLADDPVHRFLYTHWIDSDRRLFMIFGLLLLAGATLSAFTLASRIVEAQRREVGVGLALGAPAWMLAIRPLLLGVQISLLGALFGVGVAQFAGGALRSALLEGRFPLPVITTPFEPDVFLRGAALGFVLPLVATAYPVWRSVRVRPIEAIQVGVHAARGGGLAPLLERLPLPGRALAQMPPRNLLRAPRRTAMTVLSLAAVLTTVVAGAGFGDSFRAIADRIQEETLAGNPTRMTVELNDFYLRSSPEVSGIVASPAVGVAEPGLRVAGALGSGDRQVDVSIELVDQASKLWQPTVVDGRPWPEGPGIVIAEKAARDLGVHPGDTVTVSLPVRRGPTAFRAVATRLPVIGLHRNPLRMLAYMDAGQAGLMGLSGRANTLSVTPAPGVSQDAVKRALFGHPGVAAVQSSAVTADLLQDRVNGIAGLAQVLVVAALLLVVLIAFNATSIGADERRREHATMLAFGLRTRVVLRTTMVEGLLTGVLAALVGVGLGIAALNWMIDRMVTSSFPELWPIVALSSTSLAVAIIAGVASLALAPLLTARSLRRLDIPSSLRVVE